MIKKNTMKPVDMPADVPQKFKEDYRANIKSLTSDTGHLILFTGDQKIEHLNADFYGPGITAEALNPEYLFTLARKTAVGAFATHLGLIAHYGKKYSDLNYIVKLNAKTNCIKQKQRDPESALLWNINDVITFKKEAYLNIRGVGFTLYLGSESEHEMLEQAAQVIFKAHSFGLPTILWVYVRGKSIKNEQDPALIAGAAGVAAALGSDFVKIKPPHATKKMSSAEHLAIASEAAGKTKVICAGGPKISIKQFLQSLYDQIHTGKTAGCATGRNLFQRPLNQAVALSNAMAAIIYENKKVDTAMVLYKKALQK